MIRLWMLLLIAGFLPGERVLLDAHNCYPYNGKFADRITRALASGIPLGIEIDLAWNGRMIVTHGAPFTGNEPGLKEYFFETIRPVVEKALQSGDRSHWPLIVMNVNDLRSDDPALYRAFWEMAGEFQDWLCTAPKRGREEDIAPMDVKPVLILTNGLGAQYPVFYGDLPVGARLRMFGVAQIPEGQKLPPKSTNFRRWWNNSWHAVEEGGASKAGDWTTSDAARLKELVDYGHRMGYWVRFYTLDGFTRNDGEWSDDYNFGSLEAARVRWRACIEAGVDFIATDHYEDLARQRKQR